MSYQLAPEEYSREYRLAQSELGSTPPTHKQASPFPSGSGEHIRRQETLNALQALLPRNLLHGIDFDKTYLEALRQITSELLHPAW